MNLLMQYLKQYLTLPILLAPAANAGLSMTGNIPDNGSLVQVLSQMQNNAMYAGGGVDFQAVAAATHTATRLGNAVLQYTVGQAMTLTLDYAYNIVNALPQPVFSGQKFQFMITTNAATTIATPTLSSTDGGVTLAGTTAVLAASARWYQGQITQLTSTAGMPTTVGTTFVSLTRVGATNGYTLVLGTNALIPVTGQLVYLNVTAGTLPSGWYPISFVTSALNFVIMTPPGLWTMTAGTIGTGIVAPATYSPLVTITGLWALVVSTASV